MTHTPAPPAEDLRLTPAQRRILDAARAGRTEPYDGRARKPARALEQLGLVTVVFDMRSPTQGIYVTATQPAPARFCTCDFPTTPTAVGLVHTPRCPMRTTPHQAQES